MGEQDKAGKQQQPREQKQYDQAGRKVDHHERGQGNETKLYTGYRVPVGRYKEDKLLEIYTEPDLFCTQDPVSQSV
jgi:hypothetical protein